MASLNKVMLIGNAGRDAELRYLANGTAQAQFSLAVNRNYRGPDKEWKEETEWFNIVAWGDLAERSAAGAFQELLYFPIRYVPRNQVID